MRWPWPSPRAAAPQRCRDRRLVAELRGLPEELSALVQQHDQRSEAMAHRFAETQDVIFLGGASTTPSPWKER